MSIAPEVSVVMANCNGARHLSAAIASLHKQTLASWELLFVDDGSQDESVALAQALAREDSRIRVFALARNRGPAAARNHALAWASGRWIAIFDSDDLMRPDRLKTLHGQAHAAGARILADNLLLFSDAQPAGRPWLDSRRVPRPRWFGLAEFVDSNRLYSRMPDLGYLKPFISADLLRQSGLRYDEALQIGEDYDLMARLLARGEKIRFIPEPLYLYRRHVRSTSFRLSGPQIHALIDSHDRFVGGTHLWNAEEWRALARRRRSLQSMLRYDSVIAMLKAGEYRNAVRASATAPQIWPLLTRPLRARVARLRKFGKQRRAVLRDAAAPGV